MKTSLRYTACLLVAVAWAGCNKKELYTHEELYTASTLLKVDWLDASPTASTLQLHVWGVAGAVPVDTLFSMASDATVRLSLPEAEYTVVATHDAAHIRFDGECFCLATDADGLLCEPEEFSAGTGTFRPVAQQENTYVLQLFPFTRKLALRFRLNREADGRIASIDARLDGIASARRLTDRTTTRDGAGAVGMAIARESDVPGTRAVSNGGDSADDEGIFFSGSRNLLGIHTNEQQMLTLTLHYTNGEEETLEQDLTSYLEDFNNQASGPVEDLTLNAEITIAGQPGVSATIGDWTPGTDSNLDATDN